MPKTIFIVMAVFLISVPVGAEEAKQEPKNLDMVTDLVSSVFSKTNALLSGNLEVTMDREDTANPDDFERNAIGQKVPKSTAVKSYGSLHNDQPL